MPCLLAQDAFITIRQRLLIYATLVFWKALGSRHGHTSWYTLLPPSIAEARDVAGYTPAVAGQPRHVVIEVVHGMR